MRLDELRNGFIGLTHWSPPSRASVEKMIKSVRVGLVVLIATCVVVPGGVVSYIALMTYRSRPVLEGNWHTTGIHEPVSVSRDENGAVLIDASDQKDLLFALGFV